MLQHTSTPYKIATLTEEGTDTIVLGDNNATVCETYYHWRSKDECEANAKFIIKACNEHSQLVEALRFFISLHDDAYEYLDKGIGVSTKEGEVMINAKKLIGKD